MKEKKITLWGKYELKADQTFHFKGGESAISVKRLAGGWAIAEMPNDTPTGELTTKTGIPFTSDGNEQIFQTGRSDVLHFVPALPSKPVVIRNQGQIKISPRHSIKLYLTLPLNVQFYYSQVDEHYFMCEFALKKLSDTWFGETDSGEPAFALGKQGNLSINDLSQDPYEILCPVKINNHSNHQLEIERLIVRVENLAIYQKAGKLISSQVHIDFKGTDQVSNLHFSTDKAIHGEHPTQIAKARGLATKTILGKSFHFFKHLTQ